MHLIDHRRLVHPFRSHAELQEHIRNDEHYFPQGRSEREGKGEGLLRVLLRTIEGAGRGKAGRVQSGSELDTLCLWREGG